MSPVKVQSEIQVQKAQAVRDASWDAESSCENVSCLFKQTKVCVKMQIL